MMKTVDSVTSKKCWRERVTAEITVAHMVEFAREAGDEISLQQAANFLNENGHAYEMWMHMMRAGEEFIKNSLGGKMRTGSARARGGAVGELKFRPSPSGREMHDCSSGNY